MRALAKKQELLAIFDGWWNRHAQHIVESSGAGRDKVMSIRANLLDSFVDALTPLGVLDKYQLAGVIASWWGDVQWDLNTLAYREFSGVVQSWLATIEAAFDPEDEATIKDKQRVIRQKRRAREHPLVPYLLPDYLSALKEAEARRADLDTQVKTATAKTANDEDKGTNGPKEPQVSAVDQKRLKANLATSKKEVKTLEDDFLNRLQARIANLTPDASKNLVCTIVKDDLHTRLDAEFSTGARALSDRYRTWAAQYSSESDPDLITSHEDFTGLLNILLRRSVQSMHQIAQASNITIETYSTYLSGESLPSPQTLRSLLTGFGIHDTNLIRQWQAALSRVNFAQAKHETAGRTENFDSHPHLLLRVYIPSQRLYAAEASRLMPLFREWLTKIRGYDIRESGYRTAGGEMYEFHVDPSSAKPNSHEELGNFSDFLTLCGQDPGSAADLLTSTGLDRVSSVNFAAKFGREARRLEIDLRHEREQRILTMQHDLESELINRDINFSDNVSRQINALLQRTVPGSPASHYLPALMSPRIPGPVAPVTVNINPQIIHAMESTIVQNIQGTVNLSPEAREIMALIEQSHSPDSETLKSAVHELEDSAAPPDARAEAKRRLKQFLVQIAGASRDIGLDLLKKYLESKVGL